MSEHLKSPASTSESEQTKQQAKMNAIRSSLQKLEEEEEEEMLQQRIAANIQLAKEKKRFRNGLFQNHRHPSNILSENEKNVPNGKSCGISFQSGEMGSVKQ